MKAATQVIQEYIPCSELALNLEAELCYILTAVGLYVDPNGKVTTELLSEGLLTFSTEKCWEYAQISANRART